MNTNEIYDKVQADESRPEPVNSVLQGVSVLFADKSPEVLALFKHTADYLGWKGDYVSSVTEIIDHINRHCLTCPKAPGCETPDSADCYDAVVTGVNFFTDDGPRLTGFTAARQIRKVRPNIPIVFVTSYVTSILKEEARRLNAELIPKPVDIIDLFARVSQLVYWNRLTDSSKYEGDDRRKTSVYFGQERRRGTDKRIEIPRILSHNLEQVLRDNYDTGNKTFGIPSIPQSS